MATSKPRDDIIISHFRTTYDSVTVEEDKTEIFTWIEQVLKVKLLEIIFAELIKGKQRVTSTLKFVRIFVSQIPYLYQREGGDYVELANIQMEFQNLVHSLFSSDLASCQLSQLATLSAKMDDAIKMRKQLQDLISGGEEMLHRHGVLQRSISNPDGDAVNDFMELLIATNQGV